VFDFLSRTVLPELARAAAAGGRVHAWSVGCASGEEIYTVRIIWQLCVKPQFPAASLACLATDIDDHILSRARRGAYPQSSLKDLPRTWVEIAFTESNGLFWVKPEYRTAIDFRRQDVRRQLPGDQFDLILCRHLVFTYFDESLQCEILPRILQRIRPGGILVTGKQEPLPFLPDELEECHKNLGVFRKKAGPA
jgi:chemotaxis protein methyltransferase CheR